MSLTDKILEIEEEISKTKYNKATQHHIGKLKAKLAQLREEVVISSSGPKGSGYGVRKAGDATVALIEINDPNSLVYWEFDIHGKRVMGQVWDGKRPRYVKKYLSTLISSKELTM